MAAARLEDAIAKRRCARIAVLVLQAAAKDAVASPMQPICDSTNLHPCPDEAHRN